jgi:sulfite oxidase
LITFQKHSAGYAFSGGGRNIVRVEISKDQGKSWETAKITKSASVSNTCDKLNCTLPTAENEGVCIKSQQNGTRNWAWVLWEADVSLTKRDNQIWVKAVDSGYNQQPEDFKNIWNYRGLLSTAYHKISLNVK